MWAGHGVSGRLDQREPVSWRVLLSVVVVEHQHPVRGGTLLSAGVGWGDCLRCWLLLPDGGAVGGGAMSSRQLLRERSERAVGVQ